MYVDTQSEFSNAQAVTNTAISANVLDLFSVAAGGGSAISPNARIDIGSGLEDLYFVVQTASAPTSAGTPTLTLTLESADDAALTVNATTHASSGAIPFASYNTAGAQVFVFRLPPGLYRRYLGLRYTLSAALTGGTFDAFLTPTLQLNRVYKSAFTVQ